MPSLSKTANRRDGILAGFAALAILIHVLEAGVPSPIPGLKPGLANVITLIVLVRHGLNAAIWVTALRVLVGSLLVGSFLTPGFWLSAAGAASSLVLLSVAVGWNHLVPRAALTVIGLSAISAVAHVGGQFWLAWQVFVPHPGLVTLLPPLLTAALILGIGTGMLTRALLQRLPTPPPS